MPLIALVKRQVADGDGELMHMLVRSRPPPSGRAICCEWFLSGGQTLPAGHVCLLVSGS